MKIEFVASASGAEVLAVLVHEGRALHGTGGSLDTAASGALTRAMNASRFTGGSNSTLVVAAPTGVEDRTARQVENRLRNEAAFTAFLDLFTVGWFATKTILDIEEESDE